MVTNKRTSQTRNNKSLQSTADAELTSLRLRLNKKREYIAILELELFNTRVTIHEFMVQYNERVGHLEEYLRTLRRKLYEALESQRPDPEEAPPEAFEEEDEEFTYQEREENNGWRKIGSQKKSKFSPKMEEQIKSLFRELARRFHPDLTSDPEEKKWREEVMTRVNQAYAARDLKALRSLAEQPDRPVDSPNQTKEQEIASLRAELKRLDTVIADLKARIKHLEESPAWQLKMESRLKRRSGSDLLSEMEAKFREQIADLEEHLIVLGVDLEEVQMPTQVG
ncbi:J domain-containing protein [bacterium]|nr:J domain-containing protein [bacterium]MCB2178962.1 J domain-containing protein [bacterium]